LTEESLGRGAPPKVIQLNDLARNCIRRNAEDCLGSTRVKTCHDSALARMDEFSTYPPLHTERMRIQTITSRRPEANDNLDGRPRHGYTRQVSVVLVYKKRGDSATWRC